MQKTLGKSELFASNYRIEEVVGGGAYGDVWRAFDESLKRTVAIKMLKADPDFGVSPSAVRDFEAEAVRLAQLDSPSTVKVHSHGYDEEFDLFYIVMEYAHGMSLERYLAATGAMRPDRVLIVLRALLASIADAHERGVLHRDVKPANIIVHREFKKETEIKLADFGIGKDLTISNSAITGGTVRGTPMYMAPELQKGAPSSMAADVYAIGLIGVQCLVGGRYLPSELITTAGLSVDGDILVSDYFDQWKTKIIAGRALEGTRRALVGLSNAIEAMLKYDPARRYTASKLLSDLQHSEFEQLTPKRAQPTILGMESVDPFLESAVTRRTGDGLDATPRVEMIGSVELTNGKTSQRLRASVPISEDQIKTAEVEYALEPGDQIERKSWGEESSGLKADLSSEREVTWTHKPTSNARIWLAVSILLCALGGVAVYYVLNINSVDKRTSEIELPKPMMNDARPTETKLVKPTAEKSAQLEAVRLSATKADRVIRTSTQVIVDSSAKPPPKRTAYKKPKPIAEKRPNERSLPKETAPLVEKEATPVKAKKDDSMSIHDFAPGEFAY